MRSTEYILITWIVPVVILFATGLGVFYTRKAVKVRKLQYITYYTSQIIKKPGVIKDNLKILYKDQLIDVIYMTEIKFKNTGNDAITSDDVIIPLEILYSDIEIYDAEVSEKKPEEVIVNLIKNDTSISMNLNLLNSGEYFIIQILSSSELNYKVTGRIKNIKISKMTKSNPIWFFTSSGVFLLGIFFLVIIVSIILIFSASAMKLSPEVTSGVASLLGGILGIVLGLGLHYVGKYRSSEFGTHENSD